MQHPNMSDTLIACCGSIGYMLPYMRGEYPAHYPVPAIRAMVNNAHRLIQYGEICAENCFDISEVFERFVKL